MVSKPFFWIFIFSAILVSCSTSLRKPAPIVDLRSQLELQQGYHVVSPGETLYFISWRFGVDYETLASNNRITSPYALRVGEKLYLQSKRSGLAKQSGLTTPIQKAPLASKTIPFVKLFSVKQWAWPAQGQIIQKYSAVNKGVDITGTLREPIRAAAAGQVVYAGAQLRGYGNLLLIKHNDTYLTAYAHNDVLLVSEGQVVKAGEEIAKMGSTGTNRVMLHFELRKHGKPVDPSIYISH
jgi:lipoprotein NlpD